MTNTWLMIIVGLVIILVLLVLISYVIEALRPIPQNPSQLKWNSKIQINYVAIRGFKIRYIRMGEGPPIVLLHTLRTQLDIFQKIIPELSKHFTVYALDYPGHGFSDIPKVAYTPSFFVDLVSDFLDRLDIKGAIVAGESIGGTLSLLLAAKHNSRVKKAIAINAYDYDAGRGIMRSSLLAKLLFSLNNVPIIGSMNWRFRSLIVFQMIMRGGVSTDDAIPLALTQEMHEVGNRSHHYQAFMSLVHHFPKWETPRAVYGKIKIPTLLIYGEHDWSQPKEREANHKLIPDAKMVIVSNANHFLSLDAPEDVIQLILSFKDEL